MVFSGRPPWWQALRKTGRVVSLVGLALLAGAVQAKGPVLIPGTVALAQLPAEAQTTHRLILAGGPFAHRKDGTVFGNRERALPARPRGFYHEYTVRTPGARDRGARRIVCGGTPPTRPAACYYTGDHYATFRQIAP
ncbi:MAG: ribonuclease [Burkholderiales bacterium]|nr:ribonuclease [Burkholderiales bacterium]MDE2297322.1 ribonuclease [Burkholderiales bacterium]MDE2628739.1 ribonuclease [Burkholderiales bacterium]